MSIWCQRTVKLGAITGKFRMITREIIEAMPEIGQVETGLLHIFLQHTSASLTINENADPGVIVDLEHALETLAPESCPYSHTMEGPDDMPAHIKTSLFGCALTIPVGNGRLLLGTWQGIYLCEHRTGRYVRNLILTLHGKESRMP